MIVRNSVVRTLNGVDYNPTFNPVDKVVELLERMIKEKDTIIAQKDAFIAELQIK